MTSFWIGFIVGGIIFGLGVGFIFKKHPKASAEVLEKVEDEAKATTSKIASEIKKKK